MIENRDTSSKAALQSLDRKLQHCINENEIFSATFLLSTIVLRCSRIKFQEDFEKKRSAF